MAINPASRVSVPAAPYAAPPTRPAVAPRTQRAAEPAAAAPPGADPALWSILTSEERAFFSRSGTDGPATYGAAHRAGPSPAASLGQRIDVRV
jgi:hypothetical protein